MNNFITDRIQRIVNSSDIMNSNFRSSVLSDDLDTEDIEFLKSRGSVRLINRNVLTPAEVKRKVDEILAYDFEK